MAEFNGTTASFLKLSLSGLTSAPGFDASCPDGAAPVSRLPASQASINVTVYFNFSGNASIPYGNGSTTVRAGAIKWDLDATAWPFCAQTNQLMVELSVFTSATDDKPVLFDEDDDDEGNADTATTSGSTTTLPTSPSPAAAPVNSHRRALRGAGGNSKNSSATSSSGDSRPSGSNSMQQQGGGSSLHGADEPMNERPDPSSRPPRLLEAEREHGQSHGVSGGGTGRPAGRTPRLLAALLSPTTAAAFDLEAVAYDAAGTTAYNVSVYMAPSKEEEGGLGDGGAAVNVTKVVLGFPAFDTLHYDPTVALTTPADVGYAAADTAALTAAAGNAADAVVRVAAHAALGAAAALVLLAA